MKKKKKQPELEVYHELMPDLEDEILIVIRRSDGMPITAQDIIDGAAHVSYEAFGLLAEPITAQDIKDNVELN